MVAVGRVRGEVLALVTAVVLFLVGASSLLLVVEGADPQHLVTNLPGAPAGVNYQQYAGYVSVNETSGQALFYWFFTADHPNASSLPLAIWLNGGPGCSSVGNGLLGELGPFYPFGTLDNITLTPNNLTWIQEANIIFLETPVSVGYSYSNTSSDYSLFTDKITAESNLQFLLKWLEKFPEYKSNDFYLIGESYAGHYIPTFASEIVYYNDAQGPNGSLINFKGYAVGNPWTDAYYNNLGATEWWHSHDLLSDEVYAALLKNCDFSVELPVDYNDPNPICINATLLADIDLAFIDSYNIYGPYCNNITANNTAGFTARRAKEKSVGFLRADTQVANTYCKPDLITAYLNSPEVQRALHIENPILWTGCSDPIGANYSTPDIIASMLPIYTNLISRGFKIWIYNGDIDGVCPTTTARYAIKALKLDVTTPWYPWQYDTQVGGYSEIYKGLTFATVRDAGHLVPFDQPGRALSLFRHFLAGDTLPQFPFT